MGAPFQPIRPGQYHLPTVRTSTEVKATSTRRVRTYRLDLGVSRAGDVDGVEADVGLVHAKNVNITFTLRNTVQHCQNGKKMRRTWQPARLQADGPAQRLPIAAPTMMACSQVPVRVATIRATMHWPNGRGMCLRGERKGPLDGTKQCTTQAKTVSLRPTNFRLALPLAIYHP